uniref:Uncharacterized protein n=1 Tax=Eucampia antarctica TaxID=49252 RepID=A0A7S2W4D1_9STRA
MGKQADDFMEWLHVNTRGGLTNVAKVANGVVEGTNNIGGELEKRRILLWKQMQSIPEQSLNTFSTLLPLGKKKKNLDIINFEEFTNLDSVSKNRSSNVSMLLGDVSQHSTVPISDEIGVIIHPTMNFTHVLFGTMVHLYLMLLLIVSVPGSSSTKMIVKRSNNSTGDSETDSCMSNECSKQNSDSDSYERRDPYENSLSSSDLAGIELSLDVHPKKKNSYQQLKFLSSSSFEEPGDTDEQQLASSNSETPEPPQVENINPTNNSRRNSPTKMKKALSYFV